MAQKLKCIVLEDDPIFQLKIKKALEKETELTLEHSLSELMKRFREDQFDLILLDKYVENDEISFSSIPTIKQLQPHAVILILTADKSVDSISEALNLGASDYLLKGLHMEEELLGRLEVAKGRISIEKKLKKTELISQPFFNEEMIGSHPAITEVRNQIQLLGPTSLHIIILGETGSGKELVARGLHKSKNSKERPFITLNCGAIPSQLLESELFGHVKGSFTGAYQDKIGKIEMADGGDLFLDEIGELPLEAQAKLLRVLQDGEFYKVGSNRKQISRFRAISATHRDLQKEIEKGKFREDLYFRISNVEISVPPLRNRPDDIPLLAEFFRQTSGGNKLSFSSEQMSRLKEDPWIGNIRELKSRVQCATVLALARGQSMIQDEDLFRGRHSKRSTPSSGATPHAVQYDSSEYGQFLKTHEKDYLEQALKYYEEDIQVTAKSLGLSTSTFYRKMKELGMKSHGI